MDPVKALNQPIRIAGSDAQMVRWEGLTAEKPEGERTEMHAGLGRTVQAHGDFGGATLALEGSLDGNYWWELIDFDEPAMGTIHQDCRYVKPKLFSPKSKTKVTVDLMMRRLA